MSENAAGDLNESPDGIGQGAMERKEKRRVSLLGAAAQTWVWLPVTIALAETAGTGPLPHRLAVAAGALLLAAVLAVVRFLPPWAVYFGLFGAVIAVLAGAVLYANAALLSPALFIGVIAWQHRRPPGWLAIGGTGVAVNAVALIAAKWTAELEPYRLFFTLSGIFWFVVLIAAGHSRQLEAAGLQQHIVTRAVAAANRNYLAGLIAAVLVVFLLTSGLSLWHEIVRYLNRLIPEPGDSAPPEAAQPAMPPLPEGLFPEEGSASPEWWHKLLDIVSYAVAGAAGAFLLWLLLRHFFLNRSWYRAALGRLKALLARLFARREQPPAEGYSEERESLLDIRKAFRELRLAGRGNRGGKRLSRTEWEKLAAADRARRLYEDAVLSGIRAGYRHRASYTPAETLDYLSAWLEASSLEAPDAGGRGLRDWLRGSKRRLLAAYELVRYGGREPSAEELRAIGGDYPWERNRQRNGAQK
ncbi:hypothetical protein [Cohnella laeviribosi]|uniref:hypothetical protein n=1 Tax=Cohnella laeviribosi TaxID=380174 RepID=UPI003D2576A4